MRIAGRATLRNGEPVLASRQPQILPLFQELQIPAECGLGPREHLLGSRKLTGAIHFAGLPNERLCIVREFIFGFARYAAAALGCPAQVEHCLHDGVLGQPLAELLHPDEDDYFVLKPKHSGFFSTTLDVLLEYLEVKTVILVGIAANICVLFTANDAYLRDFRLIVPHDCVASNTIEENNHALAQMQAVLKADTRSAAEIAVHPTQSRLIQT